MNQAMQQMDKEKRAAEITEILGVQFTSVIRKTLNCPEPKTSIASRVETAKTFEECILICEKARRFGLEKALALNKAMSLSATIEQWRQCFNHTESGSDEEAQCILEINKLL